MSQPWTDTLHVLTRQKEIDTSAIKEYFAPLLEWLEAENKRNGDEPNWTKNTKSKDKGNKWEMDELKDEIAFLAEKLWEEQYNYNDEREWWN